MTINKEALKYYKKYLTKSNSPPSINIGSFSSKVLIATMAFQRDFIYNNEVIYFLKKLINQIKAQGLVPVIKPHPRENDSLSYYADLNCMVLNNIDPLENLFNSKLKPKLFISFSSTSLINAKLFYDINSISIINLLNLSNFHKIYRDEMNSFKKLFGKQIYFPNSIEEIFLE